MLGAAGGTYHILVKHVLISVCSSPHYFGFHRICRSSMHSVDSYGLLLLPSCFTLLNPFQSFVAFYAVYVSNSDT